MTTNQIVNKEAVRMLVQDVGYALASDKTGIPQPTLRQWAKRGGWNGRSIPHSQAVTTVTRSPADAQAAILEEHKATTKLYLAKYSAEAAQEASAFPVKLPIAQNVRHVAAVAASIWPEERQGETGLTLNLLNLVMPAESARRSAHEDE